LRPNYSDQDRADISDSVSNIAANTAA